MRNVLYVAFSFFLLVSCLEDTKEPPVEREKPELKPYLPFQKILLDDLSSLKKVPENWKLAGNAFADRSQERALTSEEGTGVLVNHPQEGKNGNLFTAFEHGDIELELDVMMPKGSNSGIYLQSRYEVQLLDSWGIENPTYADIGGIYERWDSSKPKGKEGYEGHPPKINAAKAPGLWQHLKIIFHAPRFDADGKKAEDAKFEEVWLNGVLVQENVGVTGPTRAAAHEDEKAMAPLMLQGDHGPVAFKNIKYKLYQGGRIALKDLELNAYESGSHFVSDLDSLKPLYSRKTDSISPVTEVDRTGKAVLAYSGKMDVPESGDYLFEMRVNGGALLLFKNDTVINMNGDYRMDSLGLGKIALDQGAVPFVLIFNKHTPWRRGFEFYAEGPEMQRYSVQEPAALPTGETDTLNFEIKVDQKPIAQRSFWMHGGEKRTHCISVGTLEAIHYAYDLEMGSLLQVWEGPFMDATEMWLARGEKQLGRPMGFTVSLHGKPEFALLNDEDSPWPESLSPDAEFRQLGYELDTQGYPAFSNRIYGTGITQEFTPSKTDRTLQRTISVDGDKTLWYKIADGEAIGKLPDGSFIVNDESFYVEFPDIPSGKPDTGFPDPQVRRIGNRDELLVKIPPGKQQIKYNIVW